MGRTRKIKPDFFKHERLALLSPIHRLLFIALWTQADREGIVEDRPMRLKIECLPYDKCDIDALLDDLEKHSDVLIVRYEVGGRHYLKIPHFGKHQKVHPKEEVSEHPDIPTDFFHESCMAMNGLCMNDACRIHGQAREVKEGKEVEEGKEGRGAGKPTFDLFWKVWPKRVEKQEAFKLWRKIRLDEVPAVMLGLERWKASGQWADLQFVPNPDKWLRRRKWEDEPPVATDSATRSGPDPSWRNSRAPVESTHRGDAANVFTPQSAVREHQERLKRERAAEGGA